MAGSCETPVSSKAWKRDTHNAVRDFGIASRAVNMPVNVSLSCCCQLLWKRHQLNFSSLVIEPCRKCMINLHRSSRPWIKNSKLLVSLPAARAMSLAASVNPWTASTQVGTMNGKRRMWCDWITRFTITTSDRSAPKATEMCNCARV